MRLLIVDDGAASRQMLALLAQPLDCEIEEVPSGEEAVRLIHEREFDLIFLDVMLPALDGFSVLRELRAIERSWTPVIMVTGSGGRETSLKALAAGADELLEKPVDGRVLVARARHLLAVRAGQKALADHARQISRLREQQAELTEFLVHDLKNPLAVVHLAIYEMLERAQDALDRETLADAESALRRAHGLLSDMLEVNRIDAHGYRAERHAIDGSALLRRVAAAHQGQARHDNIVVAVEAPSELVLTADSKLLTRALENLLGNALRHAPRGGRVLLSVRVDGAWIEFGLANNGPAVPVDQRQQIFEKYVSGARNPGHFGLGLYFCRRVAELHSGTIEALATPEWPALFRLRIAKDLATEA